jgi:hypothetical protein
MRAAEPAIPVSLNQFRLFIWLIEIHFLMTMNIRKSDECDSSDFVIIILDTSIISLINQQHPIKKCNFKKKLGHRPKQFPDKVR